MDTELNMLYLKLKQIQSKGWIKNRRPGNSGGIGNTLEDLLHIPENNLPLPDFGKWELKTQRKKTTSLLTLFHLEPNPKKSFIVSRVLLPKYGWPHQKAGIIYPITERSFRQTISTNSYSDRGFRVNIDWNKQIIFITFNYSAINNSHSLWRDYVAKTTGINDILPTPYWNFKDIENKLNTKLNNLMYIKASTKKINNEDYFKYEQIEIYIQPSLNKFLSLLSKGAIFVDFDARTGHNHGTKFRIKPDKKIDLYENHIIIK